MQGRVLPRGWIERRSVEHYLRLIRGGCVRLWQAYNQRLRTVRRTGRIDFKSTDQAEAGGAKRHAALRASRPMSIPTN